MSDLQKQSRALGDPTRHEVFRYISTSPTPVGVAALTDHLGLNHNAIRQHLAKLVDAKLISEKTLPSSGRGRPRLCCELDATAESRWGVTGPYERLTLLLSEIINSGDSAFEVGNRSGQHLVLNKDKDSDSVEKLVTAMARHGFEPKAKRKGKKVDIVFGSCPFVATALVDPKNVCGVHRGLAFGAAESIDGLMVDELVENDPRKGTCRLRCHLE